MLGYQAGSLDHDRVCRPQGTQGTDQFLGFRQTLAAPVEEWGDLVIPITNDSFDALPATSPEHNAEGLYTGLALSPWMVAHTGHYLATVPDDTPGGALESDLLLPHIPTLNSLAARHGVSAFLVHKRYRNADTGRLRDSGH